MHIQPLTEPETYRVQDVAAKVNELVETVNALLAHKHTLVEPSIFESVDIIRETRGPLTE